MLRRNKSNLRCKVVKYLLLTGVLGLIILTVAYLVNIWFNDHKIIFQSPVEVKFYKPVQIVKRELLRPQIIEVYNELPEVKELTPIQQYICDEKHWGLLDCRVALAVAKAESGFRPDAIGINENSVDIGIFQLNSVHFKKQGCSLAEVVDPYKNVDCAFKIWQEQGWTPWSVWKNGSFKENL